MFLMGRPGSRPIVGGLAAMALLDQGRVVKFGKRLRNRINGILANYSLVGDPPVFESGQFEWAERLEANWQAVRSEAEQILVHRQAIPPLNELSPDHRRLAYDDKWQSFFLWGYGYRVPENCSRCPETARLVEGLPGLRTAMFSIHAPGIHIPRHKGVTKGMITCHLALKVPAARDACVMSVADRMCHWDEGRTLIFDDTYPHEVWNNSREDRVILLLQVARPMRWPGRILSGFFFSAIRWSPFVQDARRNLARWNDRMRQVEQVPGKNAEAGQS